MDGGQPNNSVGTKCVDTTRTGRARARASASFSADEIVWLNSVISELLCPSLDGVRHLARAKQLPSVARTILRMQRATAEHVELQSEASRQQQALTELLKTERAKRMKRVEELRKLMAFETFQRVAARKAERAKLRETGLLGGKGVNEPIRVRYLSLIGEGLEPYQARLNILAERPDITGKRLLKILDAVLVGKTQCRLQVESKAANPFPKEP